MDTSRYQNGLIYKLCSKDPTIKDCYVGSTCNFTKRKNRHKYSCHNEKDIAYKFYVYQFIRDHGGWENWDMIELIKYPCETKRELALKEREYFEMLGGTLNKQIPTRGWKEYYQNKKEIISKRQNEKVKCDCGGKFTTVHKQRHIKTKKHQKYLNEIKE